MPSSSTTAATVTQRRAKDHVPGIADIMLRCGHDNQVADRGRSTAPDPALWQLADQLYGALRVLVKSPGNGAAGRLYRERLEAIVAKCGWEDYVNPEARTHPFCSFNHPASAWRLDENGVWWCTGGDGCPDLDTHPYLRIKWLDLDFPWDWTVAVDAGMVQPAE